MTSSNRLPARSARTRYLTAIPSTAFTRRADPFYVKGKEIVDLDSLGRLSIRSAVRDRFIIEANEIHSRAI